MFSISDIKEEAYPATYRKGKDIFETGGVLEMAYDIYMEQELPMAEISAKVRGREQDFYQVDLTVDEEFADISSSKCNCEAFYNYEGLCKHCVAALFAYVNRRQAREILRARSGGEEMEAPEEVPAMKTEAAFKKLLNRYSLRAGVTYLIPEQIYGKVELEPYFKMDYGYAVVEFKIGIEQKYVLKNISAFLHAIAQNEKVHYGKKLQSSLRSPVKSSPARMHRR